MTVKTISLPNSRSITCLNPAAFAEDFLIQIFKSSFGSLPKKELDLLVLNLLTKHTNLAKMSNQELSLFLQTPANRLTNQLYEMRLRYLATSPDDYIREQFFASLKHSKLEIGKTDGLVTFAIEDRFVRTGLHARLKTLGHVGDGSFNPDLIKLPAAAFADLLASWFDEGTANKFVEQVQQEDQKQGLKKAGEAYSFKGVIQRMLTDLGKKTTDKIINIGTDYLSDLSVEGLGKLAVGIAKVAVMTALQ